MEENKSIDLKNKKNQIIFQNVGLTYPNGFHALKDVNLVIPRGAFVAIIGSSGAGKTTLMKTVNKINAITKGKLYVNNHNITKLSGKSLRALRKDIGLVHQRYNLIESTSVLKNVLTSIVPNLPWYRKVFTFFTKSEKLHALNALEKVNMLDKAYVRISSLSGGQMQRVALARTITQSPSLILADEPVAALDPIMAKEIMDSFLKINIEDNETIIANLHHVDLAIKYATLIIGVSNGKIVYFDLSSKVTTDTLKKIYGSKVELTEEDIDKAIRENKEIRTSWKV